MEMEVESVSELPPRSLNSHLLFHLFLQLVQDLDHLLRSADAVHEQRLLVDDGDVLYDYLLSSLL